jgi:hypothetical protein
MAKGGKTAFASGRAPTKGWLMMNAMVFLPEIYTLFGRKFVLTKGFTIGSRLLINAACIGGTVRIPPEAALSTHGARNSRSSSKVIEQHQRPAPRLFWVTS